MDEHEFPYEEGEGVLVPTEGKPPMQQDLGAIAERAERNVDYMTRIKRAALRATNHRDWTSQGGEPYLEASGAEKVRVQFGISWALNPPEFQAFDDGHYDVRVKGVFSLWGESIEVYGTRSSRDPFYSSRKQWVEGKPEVVQLPASEVDRNNVVKGAITNCIGNGIKRILGIRNLTWEDLEGADIDVSRIARVEYKQSDATIETQKEQIRAMLDELCEKDPARIEAALVKLTTFEVVDEETKAKRTIAGKKSVEELTDKQVPMVFRALERQHAKLQAKAAKAAEGGEHGPS